MPNGVNYAKYIAPTPANLMGAEYGGKQRATVDSFVFAGEAAATIVNVGVLKPGEIFLGGTITAAALGSGVTVAMGYAGQAAGFLAATVMDTAGLVTLARAIGPTGVGFKNTTLANIPIFLTTGTGAATGRVDVVIDIAAPN